MAIQTYICRKHSQAHQGTCPECLYERLTAKIEEPININEAYAFTREWLESAAKR